MALRKTNDDRTLFDRWVDAGRPALSDFARATDESYFRIVALSESENWSEKAGEKQDRDFTRTDRVTSALDGLLDLINVSIIKHRDQGRVLAPGALANAVKSLVELARMADEANRKVARRIDLSGLSVETLRELAAIKISEEEDDEKVSDKIAVRRVIDVPASADAGSEESRD